MIPGVVGSAVGPANAPTVSGDPSFSSVVSLLHFDGADGGTTFTDEKGVIWTPTGTPTISTAQSKFGGASGSFTQSQALATGSSTDFALSGDFTIECWVRFNVVNVLQTILTFRSASTPSCYLYLNSSGQVNIGTVETAPVASGAVAANTWHHLAVSRTGSTMRTFLNGTQFSSLVMGSGMAASRIIRLGLDADVGGANSGLRGYLDDFRFTNGVGRHIANFTPPTAPYPNS